jgi:hypothetical protein
MNLVGKIFTVLIFVMCIVFSTFALMLHAGHKHWRDVAAAVTSQLDKANEEKAKLQQAYNLLDQQRKNDNDRSTKLIGKLQGDYDLEKEKKAALDSQVLALQGSIRNFDAAIKLAQQTLATIRGEDDLLRGQIKVAIDDRQKVYDTLVATNTDNTNRQAEINRLQKTLGEVAVNYQKLLALVQKAKISEADVQSEPPSGLTGLVTAVVPGIEISLGSDDGIRAGHRFAVTSARSGQYVGDIVVTKVDFPNRAVARAVKETMREQIEKYDHVQANLAKRR